MNQPRRVATPSLSLKRKETTDHLRPSPVLTKSLKPPPPRNGSSHASKSSFPLPHTGSAKSTRPYFKPGSLSMPAQSTQAVIMPARSAQSAQAVTEPNNLILAGYMAHEFLTKGTILGGIIDPTMPPGLAKIPSRLSDPSWKAEERYVEVCMLLKTDGSHIPGVVNPTQLARYLDR